MVVMIDREALRREALRVHARYSREVVEALGFCPWAAAARRQGRVRTRVLLGNPAELEPTVQEVRALTRDRAADIGLLVFPELALGRFDFQHFAARVREQYERGGEVEPDGFAIADFHPDAAPDLGSPARLVPFIRRSPDPTLQLVRHSALEVARRGERPGTRFVDAGAVARGEVEEWHERGEPLHARLARENFETVEREGVEQVAAVLDDILRDRDLSYERLGLTPPVWSPLHRTAEQM